MPSKKQRERAERESEMDPKLTEVSQLFERFKAAVTRDDIDSSTNLLSQLKVNACHILNPNSFV